MRILGIDPGLQVCGYACLEASQGREQLIEAGVIRTDGELAIEKRLDQIAADMDAILERLRPELVAVEQLYSHYEHPRTSILMGHARGVILQRCAAAGVEVRSFSATRIKKSVTGSGRAPKQQVQRAIRAVLALSEVPEPSDVADAMAVALCCSNSLSDVAVAAEEAE
jgi:crossover junction endodeoxyribonuclease RuvC